ncbi:MAG: hypothetical protein AB4290_13335 [Spirulina sp.]
MRSPLSLIFALEVGVENHFPEILRRSLSPLVNFSFNIGILGTERSGKTSVNFSTSTLNPHWG